MRVLQEAIDDGDHPDQVREAGYLGAQATHPTGDQIELDARPAGGVELLDEPPVRFDYTWTPRGAGVQ